jgi:hypothetical protein
MREDRIAECGSRSARRTMPGGPMRIGDRRSSLERVGDERQSELEFDHGRTRAAQRHPWLLQLRRPPGRPKGGALTSSRAVHVRGEASRTPHARPHA